ncbi:MAG TPA: GspE/PulE family protein [Candidatus Marinimicrobia bacterium]|jgi:type IV pilus assembly protein PilB|nr:GspE/PulE family protein [Candidatus Neomarinimicrobiota bacterium]
MEIFDTILDQDQRIGQFLIGKNIIDEKQVELISQKAKESNVKFGEAAVNMGLAEEVEILEALADQQGLPYIDLKFFNIERSAINHLDKETARRLLAVPLFEAEDVLAVGFHDPLDLEAIDEIALKTGRTIEVILCSKELLKNVIQSSYSIEIVDEDSLENEDNADAVIDLVEKLIEEAIESDASDIHIQPSEFELDIRYRIDGVLQSIMVLPHSRTRPINSRLKVMSNLDIAETRKPQDGRFKHQMPSGKVFDFRLSTYPTEHGEKTVMRILDPSKGQISLNKLGFSKPALEKWNDAIGNTTGIILVTGPTGSGKSTTLYATLGLLNTPDVNILTIEDPVEYNMKGIAQGQVNEKAGMTFSAALSSMLRQDPDIIMVGEMRDVATIELAIRAALTGHLVLSTLHTNDTTSSYSRLLDMGIDPFLITSTVRAIIAQRLIRRVCSGCKVSRKVNNYEEEKLGFNPDDMVFEANSDGCQNCGGKGYRGRTGIYELLTPTLGLNEMVNNRLSDHEIRTQAINDGMDTLLSESKRMVLEGITSIEEITRVL